MQSRSGKEIEIYAITDFQGFYNEKYQGFKLRWDSNIGFGEMTFSRAQDSDEWEVQTECMSDNEDKEFIHLVLNKFIEQLNVIE